MVDVNPINKNTVVNVNSSGSVSEIKTTTPQHYYDGLAKQWAISADKVQGLDYSSKYYAEKSRESAQNAQAYVEQVNNVKNEAITEITTTKNETIDGLFNISNTSKEEILQIEENAIKNIEEIKEDSKELIIKEAQEQLKNIESTGFYMRDDKLYFINSKGEEEEFAGGSGFNLFDTKIADHILQGDEAKGWALQGTYVAKALYPDFYNECLTQKNLAVETEVTLGENAITIFKHNNGHQFFNIADKAIVDTFFDTFGIADFYGVDEENERVFLPRNKWFAIKGSNDTVPVVGDGKTLGLTNGFYNYGLTGWDTATNYLTAQTSEYGAPAGSFRESADKLSGYSFGVVSDPEKSGLIADTSNVVQPNENKYLYYCVGNTVVNDAEIDAGSLVAQVEAKANIQLDNVLPSQEFKTMSASYAMPSDNYIDMAWGASGTTYTAPANGWFYAILNKSGDTYRDIALYRGEGATGATATIGSSSNSVAGTYVNALLPVKKGDRVTLRYYTAGTTQIFRFIYAEGEQ